MIRRFAFLGIAALGTAACATAPANTASGERSETENTEDIPGTALGETVYVDGPRVTPIEVVEDSRCPRDAACVWPGRLVLRASVTGGNWERTMELILGEPQQVADGTLTLTQALPEPLVGDPVQPEDYRFTFEFDGGL